MTANTASGAPGCAPAVVAAEIIVQVIYATPDTVWAKTLALPQGATARQAIAASGFERAFSDCFSQLAAIGVFGQICSQDKLLDDGDRVELYRSLDFDPMESRRRRALHRQAFMIKERNRPKRRKAKLAAGIQAGAGEAETSGAA